MLAAHDNVRAPRIKQPLAFVCAVDRPCDRKCQAEQMRGEVGMLAGPADMPTQLLIRRRGGMAGARTAGQAPAGDDMVYTAVGNGVC